jgi:phosphoglucosamine mutase
LKDYYGWIRTSNFARPIAMAISVGEQIGGTDGHRGIATAEFGAGLINESTFAGLTYALVGMQQEVGEDGPIVFARDTRPSGERLQQAAMAAAILRGAEVINLGVAPTPTAQKVAEKFGAAAAVVVTASHNPVADNGWKGMIGFGKPDDEAIRGYSERYWDQEASGLVIPSSFADGVRQRPELVTEYEDNVVATIEITFGERPLQNKLFVVDGANGAATSLTPRILRRLGARVECFACDPKGVINENCGANDLGGLKSFLARRPDITNDPDFVGALANDGDADRMQGVGMIIENGISTFVDITGNHVMGAMAEGQPGIVGTIYTNSGLRSHLTEQGIGFAECDNGDKYVTRTLQAKRTAGENWQRGGEFTGHYVDLAWLTSGDGLMSAAWFAARTVQKGMTFGDVYEGLPLWNESMFSVRLPEGTDAKALLASESVQEAIVATKGQPNMNSIIRGSGTEPVARVWIESPLEGVAEAMSVRVVESIRRQLDAATA